MSTCHQAHNIPWGELIQVLEKVPSTENSFYFARLNKYNVMKLVFDPEEKVVKKLQFFARKFEAAVQEFSKTERAKYKNEDLDKMTEICDKESCDLNEWLEEKWLNVSEWDKIIKKKTNHNYCSCSRGCLLDTLKELFIQEKASGLLCLARRGFPFESHQFVTYSNFFHYGLGRIKEDCLTLYIHLNLLLAFNTMCDPDKWYSQWIMFLDREIIIEYDGNSHSRMYQDYFMNNPRFEDLEGMQNLLKKLFRTLYIYDMVMAERGIKVHWEKEVLSCLMYFLGGTKKSGGLYFDLLNQAGSN